VAALPALILIAPDRFFWVSDHLVWALHRDIFEFRNIFRHVHDFGIRPSLSTISILPVLAIPAGLALGRARLDAYRKGMLAVTLFPALVLGMLATAQVRWLGNQEALWIAVLAVVTSLISDSTLRLPKWGRRAAGVFAVAILLQFRSRRCAPR